MKIDKQKLVELLAEKTGLQTGEVEQQLEQLTDRILDAAKRGKALEIKEFGEFYFNKEGELTFDPSDELRTEIGYKYAGMGPIEVKPERDTSIPAVDDDTKAGDEFETVPGDTTEADIDDFDKREPAPPQQQEETEKPEALLSLGEETDKEETPPVAPEAAEKEPASAEEEQTTAGKPEQKKAAAATKTKKSPRHRPPQRKRSRAGIWILAAIFLIALLAAGGYVYFTDPMFMRGESPVTETESELTIPPDDPEELPVIPETQPSEDLETLADPGSEQPAAGNTEDRETGEPQNELQETLTEEERYGLTGPVVEEANDGYSIVLHSLNSEEIARETAARYSEEGYRTLVNARTVGENTMWRVSIGQFETIEDAQAAARELPPPYNTQNFIHRIQIN